MTRMNDDGCIKIEAIKQQGIEIRQIPKIYDVVFTKIGMIKSGCPRSKTLLELWKNDLDINYTVML